LVLFWSLNLFLIKGPKWNKKNKLKDQNETKKKKLNDQNETKK
jgi:hypothetical protein